MSVSRLSRLVPLALLTAGLAGCGPDKNEFAPPCPQPSLVQNLSDISRYRANSTGHDLTDLVIQGRITQIGGTCKFVEKGSLKVETTVVLRAEMQRGPSMPAGEVEVPVFLAIADGNTIIDKTVFPVRVSFPANVDRVTMTSPEVMLVLPTTAAKSPAAFSVIAGFQLTPDELAANRHRAGR